jgi:hypothetical protein
MNTNPRKSRLLSLAALVLSALPASAEDTRMWTDKASGKTIDAAYVSADAKTRTVTIVNKEGQQFTLPVARLSDADVEFIRAKLQAPSTPPTPGAPPPLQSQQKRPPDPWGSLRRRPLFLKCSP